MSSYEAEIGDSFLDLAADVDEFNIVPACQPCNSSKGAKNVFDWLELTGRTPGDALIDALALIADEVA